MSKLFAPLSFDEFASLFPRVPQRTLKELLREHGCASKLGAELVIELDDVRRLLKATKLCPSKSTSVDTSGGVVDGSGGNTYEKARSLIEKKTRSVTPQSVKQGSRKKRSTAKTSKPRSLTLVSDTSKMAETQGS